VLKMANAYSALANNGVQYPPTLIDFIQDRTGKVIWRADTRRCTSCAQAEWDGKPMPRFTARGKQVIDPRTAYQVVHMLEGVVTRGTAVVLRDLELPLFGKTGTTTGPTNVWFAGGSPNLVSVVYLGYDQPKNLGSFAQGGTLAAPIFKQLVQTTRVRWDGKPFIAPRDIHMVRIDRISGKRVLDGSPGTDPKSGIIWEAFKAESEAKRGLSTAELAEQRQALLTALRRGAKVREQGAQPAARSSETPAASPTIAAAEAVAAE
jgi:penicillin-binding protein 1A